MWKTLSWSVGLLVISQHGPLNSCIANAASSFDTYKELEWKKDGELVEEDWENLHYQQASTTSMSCKPKHLHLALGSTSGTSMTVSFAIPFECGSPTDHEVFVKYGEVGEDDDKGDDEKDNSTMLVKVAQSQDPPRQHNATHPGHPLYISDYFYHVTLEGLNPKTDYKYEVNVVYNRDFRGITLDTHAIADLLDAGAANNFQTKAQQSRRRMRSFGERNSNIVRFTSGVQNFKTPPIPGDDQVSSDSSTPEANHHIFGSAVFLHEFFGWSVAIFLFFKQHPLKLAIVADLGQTVYSAHTMAHIAHRAKDISAILHAGDISYADCNLTRWDTWFDMVEKTAARVQNDSSNQSETTTRTSSSSSFASRLPWHICPGNHELEIEHPSGNLYASYRARFQMPSSQEEVFIPLDPKDPLDIHTEQCSTSVAMTQYDYGNSFHSIQLGLVKAILLNTYTSSMPGSHQYEWLVNELETVDRSISPWIIVLLHGPFYNTFKEHSHEKMTETMKTNMEHLFVEHDVNLVISGHVHAYR
jgi:Icc-related predicted phosphoesterase